MTPIPGTGNLTSQEKKKNNTTPISVTNIEEIKKPKARPQNENIFWYNQLWAWTFFGLLASLFFALLGSFIVSKKFLLVIPLGPISGALSWQIKKLSKRFEEKTDVLFKRRY